MPPSGGTDLSAAMFHCSCRAMSPAIALANGGGAIISP